jgi:hypothetical protein
VIGVAFISDRADLYLPRCIDSFDTHVAGSLDYWKSCVFDDRDHRLGLAGNVRDAWDWAIESDFDHLLHIEEDFEFVAPLDVNHLSTILGRNPMLSQVVLKRQPWSWEERQAGGIIEMHPDDYTDRTTQSIEWVEHRRIFSLNPCLIPRRTLLRGWPDGNEAQFTAEAVADGLTFGFYGARHDPPRVVHLGDQRAPGWRL